MKQQIIDLFSGAGGLTTGFHLAGFESICAIDVNAKALATYQHNYPKTRTFQEDIRKVNPSELRLTNCPDWGATLSRIFTKYPGWVSLS
jgi:DNA (cytosine-5)-methyltransferase 1